MLLAYDLLCVFATQLCPTLCDPMSCSLPGSSVHRILQARILQGVAISFSRGSSQPRDQTQVSCIAGSFQEKPIKFSPTIFILSKVNIYGEVYGLQQ